MSTLAISGSSAVGGSAGVVALRYADLVLLALALPAFALAGWPWLGYGALAAVWLAQRGISLLARRRAERLLAAGNRRGAMGTIAATALGRVWLVSLTVLLVGLAEREAGLAAAVLAAILFTAYLGGEALARLFAPGEPR